MNIMPAGYQAQYGILSLTRLYKGRNKDLEGNYSHNPDVNIRNLLDNMPYCFAFCTVIANKEDKPENFIFLEINKAFQDIICLKRYDVVGKRVKELYPIVDRTSLDWINACDKVAFDLERVDFEYYFAFLKKWYFITAHSSEKFSFRVIFHDITDIKQKEEDLIESEKKYKELTENAPLGILTCDFKGKIQYLNPAAKNIFDSFSEIINETSNALTHPLFLESGISILFSECMEKGNMIIAEKLHTTENGKPFNVKIRLSPIKDGINQLEGVLAIIEDITERKKMELELKKAKEEILSDHEKSEFLLNMNSEMRTTTNGNISVMDLLFDTEITEEQKEFVRLLNNYISKAIIRTEIHTLKGKWLKGLQEYLLNKD
jgi:PAS domain S-box-containing protein